MLGIGLGYWILEAQWIICASALVYVIVYYRPPGNGRHQATPPVPPDPPEAHNRLADPEYGGGPPAETDTGWLRRITSDVDVRQLPAAALEWCERRWHTGECCPASRWQSAQLEHAATAEARRMVAHTAVTGELPPPADVDDGSFEWAARHQPPPVEPGNAAAAALDVEPPALPPPLPFAITRKVREHTARIRRLDGLDHAQLLDICITLAGVDEGAQLLDNALALLGR